MSKVYHSEAAKVKDMPHVMQFITGEVADVGAGSEKITPDAIAFDGRPLEGIDRVLDGLKDINIGTMFDTVFSSHFLEHVPDPYDYILSWSKYLKPGGHLVLYMPEKTAYNSKENPEHMFDWTQEDFVFFFKRCFCGEGKNYRGEHLPKVFELVHQGSDTHEPNRYSFFVVAKKL